MKYYIVIDMTKKAYDKLLTLGNEKFVNLFGKRYYLKWEWISEPLPSADRFKLAGIFDIGEIIEGTVSTPPSPNPNFAISGTALTIVIVLSLVSIATGLGIWWISEVRKLLPDIPPEQGPVIWTSLYFFITMLGVTLLLFNYKKIRVLL